ncbi:MAG: pentapeptide repeat-containing protein [Phycisphaerae bacterium]
MTHRCLCYPLVFLAATTAAQASIIRWDTHAVIPGTQNITPGPGVNLSNRSLPFALFDTDLSSANFSQSDLRNARFLGATVTNANFNNANILNAHFDNLTSGGFKNAQLAATASYKANNLSHTTFINDNLANWDFHSQNLTSVNFSAANLANANLTNATITSATFNSAGGLSFAQIRSTASFAAHNLAGAHFNRNNLTAWNLTRQDLSRDTFQFANLTSTYFANATITGANFDHSTLTAAQLAVTANYNHQDLTNLTLSNLDLTNARFRQQNLSNSSFVNTLLVNGNLVRANLSGANLTNADLAHSTLTNAGLAATNLSDADLRGANNFTPARTTVMTNTIRQNGVIRGLALKSKEKLTIHNDATPVTAINTATFSTDSLLQFILSANWSSPLRFAPGLNPDLDGALDMEFPATIDPSTFVGQSFQLFQWNTPPSGSNRFSSLVADPRVTFDTSALYTTGVVTVISSGNINPIPEPASLTLLAAATLLLAKRRR